MSKSDWEKKAEEWADRHFKDEAVPDYIVRDCYIAGARAGVEMAASKIEPEPAVGSRLAEYVRALIEDAKPGEEPKGKYK